MIESRIPGSGNPRLAMVAGSVSALIIACGTESVSTMPGQSNSSSGNSVLNPGGGNGNGGSNGADVSGGASSTTTDCPAGSERCACYGNGTCNSGLDCVSQRCVNINGLIPATGGTGTAGVGGATVGNGTGGAASGGFGAVPTGGTNGAGANSGGQAAGGTSAAKGTGGAQSSFWKSVAYSATALPNPSNGNHNPGQNCIQCHTAGNGEAPIWAFGGTVYQSDGTTPAAHVQVGVNDGTNLYTAYSATNGNFWFGGTGTINWATAQVRIRNANGELTMAGATPAATCNLCHNGTTYPRITAP